MDALRRIAAGIRGCPATLLAGLALVAADAGAERFDEALYARLLSRHTREVPDTAGTRVDYAGLARSADWRRLVDGLGRTDPDALGKLGGLDAEGARLAYWINAYNVLAMDLVVRNYPVDSIRDVGWFLRPVWKREAGHIGGRATSLDEIEHRILRPLGEPRIHAAIVCASVSCPSLRREPFSADRLDAQLDDALRVWLADPNKGSRLDGGTLYLSRVFDWFAEDFASAGGIPAALGPFLPPATRAALRAAPAPDLAYLPYDWSLNDLAKP